MSAPLTYIITQAKSSDTSHVVESRYSSSLEMTFDLEKMVKEKCNISLENSRSIASRKIRSWPCSGTLSYYALVYIFLGTDRDADWVLAERYSVVFSFTVQKAVLL